MACNSGFFGISMESIHAPPDWWWTVREDSRSFLFIMKLELQLVVNNSFDQISISA